MDRTYIAWNFPNMITVPLMALIMWLVIATIWQLVRKSSSETKES
jgi:hypothetical protein